MCSVVYECGNVIVSYMCEKDGRYTHGISAQHCEILLYLHRRYFKRIREISETTEQLPDVKNEN